MSNEPMSTFERRNAVKEGEQNASSDAYFEARHEMLDTRDRRAVFEAGFDRGYCAGEKNAAAPEAPGVLPPLTDARIMEIWERSNGEFDGALIVSANRHDLIQFARAVAAALAAQGEPEWLAEAERLAVAVATAWFSHGVSEAMDDPSRHKDCDNAHAAREALVAHLRTAAQVGQEPSNGH